MITDVDGIAVGHWTDAEAMTGCTVILFPDATVASGEVRGGSPATREFELLAPQRTVSRLDALVLTGGSAYGLASADGVMRWCEEQGRGFATKFGVVPIVVAMGLYDLGQGSAVVRPGAAAGYEAAASAVPGPHAAGRVGAGTGATTGKWLGKDHTVAGGIVVATERDGDLVVSTLVAVNAWGSIDDGVDHPWPPQQPTEPDEAFTNTTIGLVATNALLTKSACLLVAQGAHDGLARAVVPAHSQADGDAFVAAATGAVEAHTDHVRLLAARAVERAVLSLRP